MIESMNEIKYTISKHDKERYAERIMEYDNMADVNEFLGKHESKVEGDINKLVNYGTLLYSGGSFKDKNQITDIYLKDYWVVLVDNKKRNVITLYKIDLKVGEDINREYLDRILKRLEEAKEEYTEAEKKTAVNTEEYRRQVMENDIIIQNYRKVAKALEEENATLKKLISESSVNLQVADNKVREVLKILTGNKTW